MSDATAVGAGLLLFGVIQSVVHFGRLHAQRTRGQRREIARLTAEIAAQKS